MEEWVSQHSLLMIVTSALIVIVFTVLYTWRSIRINNADTYRSINEFQQVLKGFLESEFRKVESRVAPMQKQVKGSIDTRHMLDESLKDIRHMLNYMMEAQSRVYKEAIPQESISEDVIQDEAYNKLSDRLGRIETVFSTELRNTRAQMKVLLDTLKEIEESQHLLRNLTNLVLEEKSQNQYDVFLSYSSNDKEEANQIFEAVKSAGGAIFQSAKSLSPGEDFAEEIRMALSESREVWLLVSPSSLKSDWVISEMGAAWALGKVIVPILHRYGPESLPDRFRKLQCIDFYKYPDLIKRTFRTPTEIHSV